ncbi:MAG: cysteine desulfurase [Deltaproteobacteria bacterium]|nr:cysteine desulfurase [Deltaproteobacteria bacterium]
MRRTYLDNAATTPTDPRVFEAMQPYFCDKFGNSSGSHSYGIEADDAVVRARKSVASLLGARPKEVIFTSGGTESNNTAVIGVTNANNERGGHIITSNAEHESVLKPCAFLEQEGFSVSYVPVDGYGLVDPAEVAGAIRKQTILISIMHANNEVGSTQPIAEIGKIAQKHKIVFHTDAVQTFGHVGVNVKKLRVDLLSVSGHKLYGPKGVGALYIRKGTRIAPFMHGGDHEGGRRASTLNVPGIVGLGAATELAKKEANREETRTLSLQRRLITGITERIGDAKLNGHPMHRLPGNVSFAFPRTNGELMLKYLDKQGVACSTGSSCHKPDAGPSHVLEAIGLPDDHLEGTLRFSLGRYTTTEDIDYLLDVLPGVVRRARSVSDFLD